MNLKNILITIAFLNTAVFFAQKNNLCGEIYYKQVKNISKVYEQNFIMKFSNKQSLYEEINIKQSNNLTDKESSEQRLTQTVSIGRTNTISNFFYNNRSDFYFRHIFLNEVFLVKEDKHQWNWSLHQETKKIGNFTCQKATIKFRGRNYIAWFTNEIPVTFGPWKFQGLSGLILEVYDEAKEFHIVSEKIKIENKTCDIEIDSNQFKKSLNINNYLKMKEEILNAEFAKFASKMPKGFKAPKWDRNCEDCAKPLEIFDENN